MEKRRGLVIPWREFAAHPRGKGVATTTLQTTTLAAPQRAVRSPQNDSIGSQTAGLSQHTSSSILVDNTELRRLADVHPTIVLDSSGVPEHKLASRNPARRGAAPSLAPSQRSGTPHSQRSDSVAGSRHIPRSPEVRQMPTFPGYTPTGRDAGRLPDPVSQHSRRSTSSVDSDLPTDWRSPRQLPLMRLGASAASRSTASLHMLKSSSNVNLTHTREENSPGRPHELHNMSRLRPITHERAFFADTPFVQGPPLASPTVASDSMCNSEVNSAPSAGCDGDAPRDEARRRAATMIISSRRVDMGGPSSPAISHVGSHDEGRSMTSFVAVPLYPQYQTLQFASQGGGQDENERDDDPAAPFITTAIGDDDEVGGNAALPPAHSPAEPAVERGRSRHRACDVSLQGGKVRSGSLGVGRDKVLPALSPNTNDACRTIIAEVGSPNGVYGLTDSAAYGSHPSTSASSVSTPHCRAPSGLRNYGATCYMNAVVQCLLATTGFCTKLRREVRQGEGWFEAHGGDTASLVPHAPGAGPTATTKPLRDDTGLAHEPQATAAFVELSRQSAEVQRGQLLLAVKRRAAMYNREFEGTRQCDAHEFLRTILCVMHDEINRGAGQSVPYEELKNVENETEQETMRRWVRRLRQIDDSTVYDTFGGILRSRCRCEACAQVSLTFDPFLDLSLPVTPGGDGGSPRRRLQLRAHKKQSSVVRLLDKLLETAFVNGAEEALLGGNKLYCERCQKLREGKRSVQIVQWPRILVLHLKRFTGKGKRDDSKVAYSPTLTVDGHRYTLYALCCHSGTELGGHYTSYVLVSKDKSATSGMVDTVTAGTAAAAIVKPMSTVASTAELMRAEEDNMLDVTAAPYPAEQKTWYFCNDDTITEVTVEQALAAQEEVYILFYQATSCPD